MKAFKLILLISLILVSRQATDDVLSSIICLGNEVVTNTVKLVDEFTKDNITALDLVNGVLTHVQNGVRDSTNCYRLEDSEATAYYPSFMQFGILGKMGMIMMNRSPCERDIGEGLIIIETALKELEKASNDTDPSSNQVKTLYGVLSALNGLVTYQECQKEIQTLIQIWSPSTNSTKTVMDDPNCLTHKIGKEIANLLHDKNFLNEEFNVDAFSFMAINKLALELESSFIQCEKEKMISNSSNLSTMAKIGWSVIDRSRCERSLGVVLILLDRVIQREQGIWSTLLNSFFAVDNLFNTFVNCKQELAFVKMLFMYSN
jgi:hypothetical protein